MSKIMCVKKNQFLSLAANEINLNFYETHAVRGNRNENMISLSFVVSKNTGRALNNTIIS